MIQTASLGEQIELKLKKEILKGKLKPGQRISIDTLVDKWNTSSTPVRDAVKRLAIVGFLRIVPRREITVAAPNRRMLQNTFELRIALECLALPKAIHKIPANELEKAVNLHVEARRRAQRTGSFAFFLKYDRIVHQLIVAYSGNDKLIEIINDLSDLTLWTRNTVLSRRLDACERALREHMSILEAIKAKNIKVADRTLREHLKNTLNETLASLDGDKKTHED